MLQTTCSDFRRHSRLDRLLWTLADPEAILSKTWGWRWHLLSNSGRSHWLVQCGTCDSSFYKVCERLGCDWCKHSPSFVSTAMPPPAPGYQIRLFGSLSVWCEGPIKSFCKMVFSLIKKYSKLSLEQVEKAAGMPASSTPLQQWQQQQYQEQ